MSKYDFIKTMIKDLGDVDTHLADDGLHSQNEKCFSCSTFTCECGDLIIRNSTKDTSG